MPAIVLPDAATHFATLFTPLRGLRHASILANVAHFEAPLSLPRQ